MSTDLNVASQGMEKAVEHFRTELSKLRVGRATPAMIEHVRVDAYGSSMGIKECAALATPDAKSITVQPWDRGLINDIERAILAANLGLTPMNDGKLIRINLPPLTEERRKDFVKQIKKTGEDSKVAVRNIRRDAMESLKTAKEDGDISEDEQRKLQENLQKMTDQFVAEVERLVEAKSKEVMTL